ncbi:MAG: HAMP domain-containing sensor histidine kinase, partial [Nitrospirota bacterium]
MHIDYNTFMQIYPGSLRQKLVRGYITAVILILGFVLLGWQNLNNLEGMVVTGDIVTDLFDTTLEIRRYEKNYFLYGTKEDYRELRDYVDRAQGLLEKEELELFTPPEVILGLRESLGRYMGMLVEGPGDDMAAWENRVRARGHSILTVAERISEDRKAVKRETLRKTRTQLLVGVGTLLAAVFAGGVMFYRKAVRPLSDIEGHMDRISEGEFSLIPAQFSESEFVTLKAAFNRMLLELQERQRHIVQSEKLASLGTLVFGVAHELNNPISNISTSCQILKEELEDGDPEHRRELLEQIEAESDRARDVVGTLLEYSRSKEKKRFNLHRAVAESIRLLRVEVPAKARVEVQVPEDIELFADKQKIQQMVINLVKNAVDALGDGGDIVVTAGKGPGQVQLAVRDSGRGMDEETLSKVFDPFFSGKKAGKGYGLGLFIVHNIVEEHGGTISVESSPGH